MPHKVRDIDTIFANYASKIIWIFCICYVLYQGLNLIHKYHHEPYVTNLSHEFTKNHPYPSITVCGQHRGTVLHRNFDLCCVELLNFVGPRDSKEKPIKKFVYLAIIHPASAMLCRQKMEKR